MSLLGANGKPIHAERKVRLVVEIIDQKPGAGSAESSRLGFELDSNDPAVLGELMQKINHMIVGRLNEIGFLQNSYVTDPRGNVITGSSEPGRDEAKV